MQTAVRDRLVVPPVKEFVNSLAESASSALKTFDSYSANEVSVGPTKEMAEDAVNASLWMGPTPASTSRFGKGGAFALVVLAHAAVFYALSFVAPDLREAISEPLQVVNIAAPVSEVEAPPPPVPVIRLPELNAPIVPEIDVDVIEMTAITVASGPSESTTTAGATGVPRLVSSVEYIREPKTKYPPAARALKQRGTVMLRALVDASGHAREVNVHRSSGYRVLDDAARSAVADALFKPYSENGHSISVYVFIPIEFGASS